MFTSTTTNLMSGDTIRVPQIGDFKILTDPAPGGPRGRWVFQAREVETGKVDTHHAQPTFEWEIV
jgi:hypothetical protein